MWNRLPKLLVLAPYAVMGLVVVNALLVDSPVAPKRQSGGCFLGGSQGVGGIAIDPSGTLSNAVQGDTKQLHDLRAQALKDVPGDIKAAAPLRKISLRRLEAAIAASKKSGEPLPNEVRLLAGLQNIRYVFIYPEEHDIVLAGFAEGWKVDERGHLVGLTTGRPVILLDDLLVALRSASESAAGGITCSIDPSPEGLQRLAEYVKTLTTIENPQTTIHTIEQLLGPQTISLRGVPPTSHFARVLVAADYRMKRLGMNFEPAPVAGLPSYIQMLRPGSRGMQSMTPRWWLVPNYAPLATDDKGLAFELRGAKVKCLTEETFFGDNGARAQTGKVSPVAQQWADNMTARYDELSLREPIFGQLRNCMDLAIVAALIFKENLPAAADLNLGLLLDSAQLAAEEMLVPRQVDTQASFVKKGHNWVISASGGVEIHPWQVVDKLEKSAALAADRERAVPHNPQTWWWN
jgi:hypothetical protein